MIIVLTGKQRMFASYIYPVSPSLHRREASPPTPGFPSFWVHSAGIGLSVQTTFFCRASAMSTLSAKTWCRAASGLYPSVATMNGSSAWQDILEVLGIWFWGMPCDRRESFQSSFDCRLISWCWHLVIAGGNHGDIFTIFSALVAGSTESER